MVPLHPSYATASAARMRRLAPLRRKLNNRRAFRIISDAAPAVHLDARDVAGGDGDVQTWPARTGADASQATSAWRPAHESNGWDNGGPCVQFDDDSHREALDITVDFAGEATHTLAAVASRTDSGDVFRALFEYSRPFHSADGVTMLFGGVGANVYGGHGAGGVYEDAQYAGITTAAHCIVTRGDTSQAAGSQIDMSIDGSDVATVAGGTGAIGNYAGGAAATIGARSDGAGGLERALNGRIRSLAIWTRRLTDSEVAAVDKALRYLARML